MAMMLMPVSGSDVSSADGLRWCSLTPRCRLGGSVRSVSVAVVAKPVGKGMHAFCLLGDVPRAVLNHAKGAYAIDTS